MTIIANMGAFRQLEDHPVLCNLSFEQVMHFVRLVAQLKRDIQLPLPLIQSELSTIIFARATMYGAEAVSNFLVMVKNAFLVPGAQKPEHLIYDSNCDAKQQVMSSGDPYFADMGMCVNIWHFLNKHKVTHAFCQKHCNSAMYLVVEGQHFVWQIRVPL